jgi:hypothetical protein
MIAFKFTTGEIPPLENFKNFELYQLKEKLLKGEKLTKIEENTIISMIERQGYKVFYRLQGWQYSFKEYMNEYCIKTNDGLLYSVYAFNKVQARKLMRQYHGKVIKIIQLN